MSQITESEIKSMTKEQNYMRGYKDGKSDVLGKIRAEIKAEMPILSHWQTDDGQDLLMVADALECIDRHTGK